MIFRPELIGQVLKGKKTTLVVPADTDTCPFQLGRSYAVLRRHGGAGLARVKVTANPRFSVEDLPADGSWDRVELEDLAISDHVWLVRFKLWVEESPRLLAPGGRAGDGHGYTSVLSQGMREEPEAVERDIQDELSMFSGQADIARRLEAYHNKTLADKLREIEDGLNGAQRQELNRRIEAMARQCRKRAA